MLEASSQQKQECKPHSFHECAACEGGKVKGAVIQRNCKQEVLILSFPIRPYIQSKQNHFFLQNLILGKKPSYPQVSRDVHSVLLFPRY